MAGEDRGPLLKEYADGTKIYQNGIVKSDVFFKMKFLNLIYESKYDFNTGAWSSLDENEVDKITVKIPGSKIWFGPGEESGDLVFQGGQIGIPIKPFDAALVFDENGEVEHLLLGASASAMALGKISFGFRIRDEGDNLSSYNTITITPGGQVIITEHTQGNEQYPGVKVKISIYDADGVLTNEIFTNIHLSADGENIAAQMGAGLWPHAGNECFLTGTPIDMWPTGESALPKANGLYNKDALLAEVWQKPIEDITPADIVLSYDKQGNLVPGKVTRTFQNNVNHLLDVHGLKVTPGHVTLCGDGKYAGRHVPIIDILLSDGAMVRESGDLIRMSINKPVGSVEDHMVQVLWAETAEDIQTGNLQTGKMRVGTLLFDRDGEAVSVLDCLQAEGLAFDPETGLVNHSGQAPTALHWFGRLPRPEDYILRRSRETLEGILTDGEWEAMPSDLIAEKLRMTRQMQTH